MLALKVSRRLARSLIKIETPKMAFQGHNFSSLSKENSQGQKSFPFPLVSFQALHIEMKSHLCFILRSLLEKNYHK